MKKERAREKAREEERGKVKKQVEEGGEEEDEGPVGGEGEDEEARVRRGSASRLRLLLLLSWLGTAEGRHPVLLAHPLGRLGVDDLYLRRRAGRFCSWNSTAAFG